MTWELTWGDKVDFLKDIEQATGQTPGALLDRPTLQPHLQYYRDAYGELAGSRLYAASGIPLPIPISEILAYCAMYGITGADERHTLFKRLRALDEAFLEVLQKKGEQGKPPASKT